MAVKRSVCALAALLTATAVVGCEARPAELDTVVTRDSAGTEIVELGNRPADQIYRRAESIYRVGWDPSRRLFDAIREGVLFSDGRAAIADFGPREIVVLTPTGEVESVIEYRHGLPVPKPAAAGDDDPPGGGANDGPAKDAAANDDVASDQPPDGDARSDDADASKKGSTR